MDREPLLVNFDYSDTLIKDLYFGKSAEALIYQLTSDEDMMGRMWALGQLSEKAKATSMADAERKKAETATAKTPGG